MNLLAHIYLSGSDKELLLGNLLGDFVKGNQHENYPSSIQKGILFHRKIDYFTDEHELVKEVNSFFKPELRHYSGVATDIIFDHILAKNWNDHHSIDLNSFAQDIYLFLTQHQKSLPPKAQLFFKYMAEYNWLYNYAKPIGIQRVLEGMSRRTIYKNELPKALEIYLKNEASIDALFFKFWIDIKKELM